MLSFDEGLRNETTKRKSFYCFLLAGVLTAVLFYFVFLAFLLLFVIAVTITKVRLDLD